MLAGGLQTKGAFKMRSRFMTEAEYNLKMIQSTITGHGFPERWAICKIADIIKEDNDRIIRGQSMSIGLDLKNPIDRMILQYRIIRNNERQSFYCRIGLYPVPERSA